jgi:hypothetical protein
MKKIYPLAYSALLICVCLLFSAWGTTGHWKINEHAPASFPPGMEFLKPSWSVILPDHASDADKRKYADPDEVPRHFINIDEYPEFLLNGRIAQAFDSVVDQHGITFVMIYGILPWATLTTFDSLKNCFSRNDFEKAALFAADLGHYIGDGHQPLHLTRNYDGQYTNQDGIHSRYETKLINEFSDSLLYRADTALLIQDVSGYVFSYIYEDFKYVDSILIADRYADSVAGNNYSGQYLNIMWSKCGKFTTRLFQDASYSLARMIYTAWALAGNPNSVGHHAMTDSGLLPNFPKPAGDRTMIPVDILRDNVSVTLKIFDLKGNVMTTLVDSRLSKGRHTVIWETSDVPSGIYYCVLGSGNNSAVSKIIVQH